LLHVIDEQLARDGQALAVFGDVGRVADRRVAVVLPENRRHGVVGLPLRERCGERARHDNVAHLVRVIERRGVALEGAIVLDLFEQERDLAMFELHGGVSLG
jgi:hypothetical protein